MIAEMKKPLVTEIQRFSLHDGPGIRTTVFLKGCPLHCPWCHNPESLNQESEVYFYVDKCTACGRCEKVCPSGVPVPPHTPGKKAVFSASRSKCLGCSECVLTCPSGALETVGSVMDIHTLVTELLADKVFYESSGGGVTISGGEPLIYPEFVYELAHTLKIKENVHVAIETCGSATWERIEPLLEVVDLFIVDIKSMFPDKVRDTVGGSLQLILSNVEKLINSKAMVRIHLPIIPGFNDSVADTEAYVNYLGQFVGKLSGVDVLPYHSYATRKYAQLDRMYQYQGVSDLEVQKVVPLVTALKQRGLCQVTIGGDIKVTA